jgi:glycosyltransferase involved in cell wall biosynthesis
MSKYEQTDEVLLKSARIDALADTPERPLWSVMIPTFNCAKYLEKTLESVLAQDPGREKMQIEVVDDGSTLDDPLAVVDRMGRGRVRFHRNRENTGCCTFNFNICIRRSRGRLVHILHGDDWVGPGFYEEIERLHREHPAAALLAARSVFTDQEGRWKRLSPHLPKLATMTHDASDFWVHTELQCAGVVVRRDFYEQHGGFRPDLIHSADHEMWHRAISRGGGVVSPEVLAAYRVFDGNDTSRLMRTAENLRDRLRLIRVLKDETPAYPWKRAMKNLLSGARRQYRRFAESGDQEAAAANARFLVEQGGFAEQLRIWCRRVRS